MYKDLHVSKWFWAVLIMSILSSLLKLSGMSWGFPATLHNDESNVIRSAMGMRFGDLNPHHFDWPSLYFYINYFIFAGFIKFRVLMQEIFTTNVMQKNFSFWWGPDLPFYFITRAITSIFFSLNIAAVYFLSKEYGLSKKLSFLTSCIFAVGFLSNYFSFYGISDTAFTFFITICAYFCIKIVKNAKISDYILAGTFAGLATSIKYNGALMCILIFVAHLMYQKKFNIFNKKLFISAFASIALFFMGTPYALLDWKTFSRTDDEHGAFWQNQHIGHGYNWLYHLFQTTPENFGWLATFLGFFSVFVILKIKKREHIYLLISYLAMLLYIGSWGITRGHYSLPMFPLFAVMIVISLEYLTKDLNKNIFYIAVACLLIPSIINTTIEVIKRNHTDTRISSGEWINQNIPAGSEILSVENLTGYFGGSLPVYEYKNYKVYKIGDVENPIDTSFKIYYLIVVDKKQIDNYDYSENELIYSNDASWTTGPDIKIYKLQRAN